MKKKMLSLCVALTLLASLASAHVFSVYAEKEKKVDQISNFEISGADASLQADSVDFTLTKESATIQFVRPLAASGFSFKWNGIEDADKKLDSLSVILADSEDSDCSVKITFGKLNDENTSIKYNNETRSYLTAGSTYKKNVSDIGLRFKDATNTFTDDTEAYSIHAKDCMNGNAFDGFESMGVTLTIQVTGKVGATFSLKSINEQPFGSDYETDTVDPVLCIPTEFTKILYGSTATLPRAAAFDVFSDTTTLELTVQDPDGEIVEDESGKKLENVDGNKDYDIKFSKYGQYRISYVASDGVNATRSIGYQISVLDSGKPEIQLKKDMKSEVAVGTEISFPELVIEDNADGEYITWVNLLHPEGYMTCEKTSFTPDTEGKYVITFCAQDESGNIGRLVVEMYAEGGNE